ncbi:MAG TPA: helix-turn-helix domain-containing protein [Chthoniobacteraceae bacterium]|nr:helix-turn-helix domain-containing protein [Chthoniobacteraceae bacterium]
MGIYIHGIAAPGAPFASLSEQVMAIPPDQWLTLENRSLKVVYFIGGNGELRLDGGGRYPIHAGDLFVLPHPCRQHYLAADRRLGNRLHALIVRLDPGADLTAPLARYLHNAFPGVARLPTHGWFDFRDGWIALQQLRLLPSAWHYPLARALLTVWLARAAEKMARYPALPSDRRWEAIDRAAARLAETAGEAHWKELERLKNDPALAAAFTRHFGKAPSAFSLQLRLERAKAEMVRLSEPLSQIARRAGFSSLSTFSRAFRHAVGRSPTDYRNQYRSAAERSEPTAVPSRAAGLVHGSEADGWQPLSLPWSSPLREAGVLFPLAGCCEVSAARKTPQRLSDRDALLLWIDTRASVTITETVAGGRVVFFPFSLLWPDATARERRDLLRQCRAASGEGGMLPLPVERFREIDALRACLDAPASPHAAELGAALVRLLFFGSLSRIGSQSGTLTPRPSPHRPLIIEHVHEYIRKNIHRPMTLAELAWDAGVSEEHLARLYRAATGETLFGYIKACRLTRASQLLLSTSLPVHAIAEQTGFSNAGLFGRTFKAAFGETPGAFRRSGGAFGKGISSRDHDAPPSGA